MVSYSRERSIAAMTGTTSMSSGGSSGSGSSSTVGTRHQHIASGFITDGMEAHITKTFKDPQDLSSAGLGDDSKPDEKDFEEEAIMLPQSTHSLLFTQPMCSLPFVFAISIVALSYTCLILALVYNIDEGTRHNKFNVPYNVPSTVRVAQYLAIVIALLMEEEIPSALYLLRMIPKKSLHKKYPQMKFGKFIFSAVIRLISGYLFLINTFLVVSQADAVLEIFYDVLAIQFLQQLDDIAFNLAKIDVFGKRLKRACTSKCFLNEFEKVPFASRKKLSVFLQFVYFLNFCLLFGTLIVVSTRQIGGYYHCNSVTVTFGDDIWEDSIVMREDGTTETNILLFSYFNGVYKKSDKSHDGRPVYIEQNKFFSDPYRETVGAEIKYCNSEGAWVFSHPNIRKNSNFENPECPWLLKSPETTEYNLLSVSGYWSIWVGTIKNDGQFSAVCNTCYEQTDCNYHGECNAAGRCECLEEEGYFGNHCEHKSPCPRIHGGKGGTWRLGRLKDHSIFYLYGRPVYVYEEGLNSTVLAANGATEGDVLVLLFSGSRWFGTVHKNGTQRSYSYWEHYLYEFHSYWENAYSDVTRFVSDATTQSSPIALDFYLIGQRGEEFGPFGEMHPLREPKGSGLFRCEANATSDKL